MTVTRKSVTPDGVMIHVEDWSADYPKIHSFCDTLAAHPISKWNLPGVFSPTVGERFRAEFRFQNAEECTVAFDQLESGEKNLADFIDNLWRPEYAIAITGGLS